MTDADQASYWKGVAERALAKQHEYEAQLARAREALERALIAPADYGDATIFARGRASLATEILTDLRSIPAPADGRGEFVNFGPSDAGCALKARLNAESATPNQSPTEARDDGVSYQELFDAIAAATKIEAGGIGISVAKFRQALSSAACLKREPVIAAIAALAAAISLLERTPKAKKAAPSDRMFEQMLADYRKALDEARSALTVPSSTAQTGDA